MKHNDVLNNLFDYQDHESWMHFKNLNSSGVYDGLARIDMFSLKKSYTKPDRKVFEVKVSTSDFRQDFLSGKYLKYFPFCNLFYFAVTENVEWKALLKNEKEIGVTVYNPDRGWRVAKSPKYRKVEPMSGEFCQSILINKICKQIYDPQEELRRLEMEIASFKKEINLGYRYINKALDKKGGELFRKELELNRNIQESKEAVIRDILKDHGVIVNKYLSNPSFWKEYLINDILKLVEDKMKKIEETWKLGQGGA